MFDSSRTPFPSHVPFQIQELSVKIGNRVKPRSLLQQSALFSEPRAVRPLRNQSRHVYISWAGARTPRSLTRVKAPRHFTQLIIISLHTQSFRSAGSSLSAAFQRRFKEPCLPLSAPFFSPLLVVCISQPSCSSCPLAWPVSAHSQHSVNDTDDDSDAELWNLARTLHSGSAVIAPWFWRLKITWKKAFGIIFVHVFCFVFWISAFLLIKWWELLDFLPLGCDAPF